MPLNMLGPSLLFAAVMPGMTSIIWNRMRRWLETAKDGDVFAPLWTKDEVEKNVQHAWPPIAIFLMWFFIILAVSGSPPTIENPVPKFGLDGQCENLGHAKKFGYLEQCEALAKSKPSSR